MVCMFFIAFLHNSCNFQYLILGWSTLVLSPSYEVEGLINLNNVDSFSMVKITCTCHYTNLAAKMVHPLHDVWSESFFFIAVF